MNITAQIFGFIAITFMALGYLKTTKKGFLYMQIVANIFYAIQYFLVDATSAFGMVIITVIKSLIFYKTENKDGNIPLIALLFVEIITIIFGVFVVNDFNSLLPIIISCIYTYGTWQKNLKATYLIGTCISVVWFYYNIVVGAYIAIIGNVFEFVTSLLGILKIKMKEKKSS